MSRFLMEHEIEHVKIKKQAQTTAKDEHGSKIQRRHVAA